MPNPPARKTAEPTPAKTPDRPDHPSIAAALCAFQAEAPVVNKGQTAQIPGKDGKQGYSYKYADLADVTEAAKPILAKHGLSFTWVPVRVGESNAYELLGRLLHTTGEHIEGSLPLQGRSAQELGSSITYARRYLFGCITGLVTDEDDDGARANAARERTTVDRRPAAARLWADVQATTIFDDVKRLYAMANGNNLLDVPVEHIDGSTEPLGAAIKRYGDSVQNQGA